MPYFATTSGRRGIGRLRFWVLFLAGWGLLLVPPFSGPFRAQEEEDLTDGMADIRIRLDKGRERFAELEFAEAIQELTVAIETYESGKLSVGYAEETIQWVAEALNLRAQAHFNQGEKERAREDFEDLLRLKIDFEVDRERVSPKVVALFDDVKAHTVGSLSVTSEPPGAEAWLNEEPLPRTPVTGKLAIVGEYTLRLSLPGYEEHEETLTVEPHSEVKLEISLTPNQRDLQFITQPSGVNVSVDGELKGTTFGSLPTDLHDLAREAGLDPLKASAPLLVKNVDPGRHEVLFEKECYKPNPRIIQVALDLEENTPQVFKPVMLSEQHGQLEMTSHPSGARVLVEGEPQGTTPLQLARICAGERKIRLEKAEGGSWFDTVRIQPNEMNALDVTLRPTLLYLGTFRLDEWGRLEWSQEDDFLRGQLPNLRSVNRVPHGEEVEAFRSALLRDMAVPEYADRLRQGDGLPSLRVLEALTEFRADLLMAVISLQDRPGRGAPRLFLYSSEQPDPDIVPLDLADEAAVRSFLTLFDEIPDLSRPWIGATFADSLLREGPIVVRVVGKDQAPAASAGLVAGDEVMAANGRKTASAEALRDVLSALDAGDRARLDLRRQGNTLTIEFEVGRTPVLVPTDSPNWIYNKALSDYRQLSRGADDPLDRALALLNLGISFMHFGSYDKALSEALNSANLPSGGGISQGTVRYYQGLCYLKKELIPEARTAFQQAAEAAEATVESNDGPLVSVRARKLLQ